MDSSNERKTKQKLTKSDIAFIQSIMDEHVKMVKTGKSVFWENTESREKRRFDIAFEDLLNKARSKDSFWFVAFLIDEKQSYSEDTAERNKCSAILRKLKDSFKISSKEYKAGLSFDFDFETPLTPLYL